VIVNPVAGAGSTGNKWKSIRELLTQSGLLFDYVYTDSIGHAAVLANEAALSGYKLVVSVGGDGTLNEVVNGLVEAAVPDVTLGIISTGGGSDFVRSLNIPRDYRQSCLRLANSRKVRVDIGVIEYQRSGKPAKRFFINAAGLGLDGEVVENVVKNPRPCQGTVPYVLGLLHSLAAFHNKDVTLRIGDHSEDLRVCSVVVANGRFFGGGMKVAPEADVSDGLFEVVVVGDISKLDLLLTFPRIYRGTHITHPKVRMQRATEVRIESQDRVLIQADGELLGEIPATFRILPSALSVAV
jgi:YegS/Rv2252/BmrU family lipid kinase